MYNISLEYFNLPPQQKYHIYRIGGSKISQQPHSHDYYQICCVLRGQIQHWQGDTCVTLVAGDAFVVPPEFVHRIVFPEPNAQVYSLSFQETLFHAGFSQSNVYHFMTALKMETLSGQSMPIRMKVTLSPGQIQTIQSLMEALCREQETLCPEELSASGSLIAAILCVLSQGYFQENAQQLEDVTRYDCLLRECIAYIDAHFTQPLSLNDLTKRFALSRSRFSMLFPQYTGTTLKRYIAQKRIGYALTLLRTTSLSVQEISQLAGFSDTSTFYRNFTKVTGLHPSTFRADKENNE